jgi:outer membrane protein OmpA-like peptidoglycan-associated protein
MSIRIWLARTMVGVASSATAGAQIPQQICPNGSSIPTTATCPQQVNTWFFIFYASDTAIAGSGAAATVAEIIENARALDRPLVVTIVGHSDGAEALSGTGDRLSRERAAAIAAALSAAGLPARHRVVVSGVGPTEPRVVTERGTSEAQNRRVEVTITVQ